MVALVLKQSNLPVNGTDGHQASQSSQSAAPPVLSQHCMAPEEPEKVRRENSMKMLPQPTGGVVVAVVKCPHLREATVVKSAATTRPCVQTNRQPHHRPTTIAAKTLVVASRAKRTKLLDVVVVGKHALPTRQLRVDRLHAAVPDLRAGRQRESRRAAPDHGSRAQARGARNTRWGRRAGFRR